MARQSQGASWRRVIACILAYALAAQGFIFALDIGRSAMAAADDASAKAFAGLELCSHSGGTTSPQTPSQGPIADLHCLFCLAGAVYVNCAPPCAPQWNKVVAADAAWLPAAAPLRVLAVHRSAWPRGPPAAA